MESESNLYGTAGVDLAIGSHTSSQEHKGLSTPVENESQGIQVLTLSGENSCL